MKFNTRKKHADSLIKTMKNLQDNIFELGWL